MNKSEACKFKANNVETAANSSIISDDSGTQFSDEQINHLNQMLCWMVIAGY